MTLRNTLIAASIVVASTGAAFADHHGKCTEANIAQKTQEMTLALQTIAQKDAARMQAITAEMQEKATAAQTSGDVSELCAFYDALIEEAKQ